MKFNAKELAEFAKRTKEFNKEGQLHIKEKIEGKIRKNKEVYVERWCKLYGNLLFCFKSKEEKDEPVSVIVLERCTVELDPSEQNEFSFQLVFEGESRVQYMYAKTELDRDGWIEALHIASYECMKMQLGNLRELLKSKTGRDPLDNSEVAPESSDEDTEDMKSQSDPILEVGLQCNGLVPSGEPPTTRVDAYIITPPHEQWVKNGHTEVVEKNSNPVYSRTICFDANTFQLSTRIKMVVNCLNNNQPHPLGETIFTMNALTDCGEKCLRLSLNHEGISKGGTLSIKAWKNTDEVEQNHTKPVFTSNNGVSVTMVTNNEPVSSATGGIPTKPPRKSSTTRRLDKLKPWFANVLTKTYWFQTKNGDSLRCHEYMAECVINYHFPQLLLKLWIDEDRKLIEELHNLGKLPCKWDEKRKIICQTLLTALAQYQASASFLRQPTKDYFKSSLKKSDQNLSFVPTNLHLQRLWVIDESKHINSQYDILTVGAFTGFSEKYKEGGLLRMLKQQDSNDHGDKHSSSIEALVDLSERISECRDNVHHDCETITRAALNGNKELLQQMVTKLSENGQKLASLCLSVEVTKAAGTLQNVKKQEHIERSYSDKTKDECGVLKATRSLSVAVTTSGRSPQGSPRMKPKTSFFRKSEPSLQVSSIAESTENCENEEKVISDSQSVWDEVVFSLVSDLTCLASKVEDLCYDVVTETNKNPMWYEEVNPLVLKLRSRLENVSSQAKEALLLQMLQEYSSNLPQKISTRTRLDMVMGQALTTLTAGFVLKLKTNASNLAFFKQIQQVGLLAQFEGLLSCHGDEMSMIEDYAVAVQSLKNVSFQITAKHSDMTSEVSVTGHRSKYIVTVPTSKVIFTHLPLDIQQGHVIPIVPVLFNIGINEQASLAETFGNTHIQESVNIQSLQALEEYFKKCGKMPDMASSETFLKAKDLLTNLRTQVSLKKSKNTEILDLSAKICRILNGIRFTSCKSAKDRTAMAVTLEQVRILEEYHSLAPSVVSHALECTRSDGVRRSNTKKNTGKKRYAFSRLQIMSFPQQYRPPNGTFGSGVDT